MGWKTTWFGSEAPSARHVGKTVAALGLAALMLLGLISDFVPHPILVGWDAAIAFLVLGTVLTAWLFVYAYRQGRMAAMLHGNFVTKVVVVIGMPFFFALFSWLILKASGSLLTRMFGQDFELAVTMETHFSSSRKSCDYRLQGGPLGGSFPSYICISEQAYRAYPEASIPVVLVGRKSWFGLQIDDVLVRRP